MTDSQQPARPLVPPPPIPIGGVPSADVPLPVHARLLGVILAVAGVCTILSCGVSLLLNALAPASPQRWTFIGEYALMLLAHTGRLVVVLAFLRRAPWARQGLLIAVVATFVLYYGMSGVEQAVRIAHGGLNATLDGLQLSAMGMSAALLIAAIRVLRRPDVVQAIDRNPPAPE